MNRPLLDMISVVNLFMALVLIVTVDAQGPTSTCVPAINIRKNTLYTASRKSQSNITCPVRYCEEIPTIRWIKIDTTKWIPITKTNQITITQETLMSEFKTVISKLIFKNLSAQDSGIYRCAISGSNFSLESHNINLNVSDFIQEEVNTTASTPVTATTPTESWLPYIFIFLGIICLVGVVMSVSFLIINGCSRKSNSSRTKYVMSCPIEPSPTISKSDVNTKGQVAPEQRKDCCNMSTVPLQDDLSSGIDKGSMSQIVYATLEHLTPREPSAIRHSREALTEYASIRIS